MTLNNEQYERIARWLDGAEETLSAEELAAANEIRADESLLQAALNKQAVPQRAMSLARRRLRAAAGVRVAIRARFVAVAAAGAAVAAALVAAWALRVHVAQPAKPAQTEIVRAVPLEVFERAMEEPGGGAYRLISGELDSFEADLAVAKPPSAMERQIDSVQQDIDNFWTEDSPLVPES